MPQEIKIIKLTIKTGIIKLGEVNCYLVKTGKNYFLIDTGPSNRRFELEKELENAGCKPGNLKLIIITHGDFDHTGNAAYLREKFNTKIAMHHDDLGMVEYGDMFWNRESNFIIKRISPILFRFGKNHFRLLLPLQEGFYLFLA
ncbi:MAG: MBL fold metallo-hydrolase, partial [Methanobacterium sp.]|nr:MBL fold metallo-hydrolase [Methanobacterium sp.]